MSNINCVLEEGNLTRDAEIRYTGGGMAISRFSIAVNDYKKDSDDYANFFNCVLFGKKAEGLNGYLLKGTGVIIQGRLHQDRWTDDNGNSRNKVEIHVNQLSFKGRRKDDGGSSGSGPGVGSQDYRAESEWGADYEDDIPF